MIQMINEDDVDFLMETTQEFNDRYYDIPLDLDKARAFVEWLIPQPASIGFRSDQGYIIGAIEDDPFRDYAILREYGWFANDRSGLALLTKFQDHAKECGVNELRMTTLSSNPMVSKLLTRRGYTELETSYIMRF